jgi:hypothetical protein
MVLITGPPDKHFDCGGGKPLRFSHQRLQSSRKSGGRTSAIHHVPIVTNVILTLEGS